MAQQTKQWKSESERAFLYLDFVTFLKGHLYYDFVTFFADRRCGITIRGWITTAETINDTISAGPSGFFLSQTVRGKRQ